LVVVIPLKSPDSGPILKCDRLKDARARRVWRGPGCIAFMPELPEVETIVRSLRPLVLGRQITAVELRRNGSSRSSHPTASRILASPAREFEQRLPGCSIESIERVGKNIVFHLRPYMGRETRLYLLVHLGMTGRLTCETTPEFRQKHTHLVMALAEAGRRDSPHGTAPLEELRWLHYSDIRRFGRLRLTARPDEALSGLGADPLEIREEEFFRLLRSRRSMLKSLLLDQHFLRGIGNIYADESLFRAGIHPAAHAARLDRKRALRLYEGIRETLSQAIAQGGSSISDFVDGQGYAGNFQVYHQVYQRTGEPCVRCGAAIRRIIVSSRGTHFCPRCQRGAERRAAGVSLKK